MTDFVQFLVQGLALGAVYALVALGFVIIYKSTEVINFAQGELMLLGTYLVFAFKNQMGLGFYVAVALAVVGMAVFGLGVERTILRPMVGKPVYAVIMITIGLSIVIRQGVQGIWGPRERILGDPWGQSQIVVGGVRVNVIAIVTIITSLVLVGLFFAFFNYTKAGVAMRATAFDQESALAVGIPVHRVYAWSWAIAAGTGTVAGVFLSGFPRTLSPALGLAALRAFPAIILGGLDSPGGAVIGGFAIGIVELMVQAYQPDIAPWLGRNFHIVAAYIVMIIVLMVRPYGLFGTREVERV